MIKHVGWLIVVLIVCMLKKIYNFCCLFSILFFLFFFFKEYHQSAKRSVGPHLGTNCKGGLTCLHNGHAVLTKIQPCIGHNEW